MQRNEHQPRPGDPGYIEWLLDESLRQSFPASDPASITQPG
jgi:hypothetical protein